MQHFGCISMDEYKRCVDRKMSTVLGVEMQNSGRYWGFKVDENIVTTW